MAPAPKHPSSSASIRLWPGLWLAVLLGMPASHHAVAEVMTEAVVAPASAPAQVSVTAAPRASSRLEIDKSYALGIANFDLDHETEVTGWQVGERWFFGRQRGLDSGLTLVWQQQSNQVSVSRDGVRFTRRF